MIGIILAHDRITAALEGLAGLACISHQLSAVAGDLQQSAAFARLGVLDVPQVRAPRPSGRKHHISLQLPGLSTKAGEICRLGGAR